MFILKDGAKMDKHQIIQYLEHQKADILYNLEKNREEEFSLLKQLEQIEEAIQDLLVE